MRRGPFTGGAVLLPWGVIDLRTRRRLLAARPIAAERRRAQTFAMFAVAYACGFALVLVSGRGFGQVDHAWLMERPWLVVPYALLLVGIVVPGAWLARRMLSAGAWFPYERALLQLDALERTPRGLVVRPFGDARHAVIDRGFVELQYADGSTFRVRTASPPDVMNVALGSAEDILARASLSDDRSQRDVIDPLTALRDERGFAPRVRTRKLAAVPPSRDRAPAAFALLAVAATCAAQPLLAARNRLSDDAGFTYALGMNDIASYDAYLENGKRHGREVSDGLLPPLLLDDAQRHNDPDAIATMLTRFPGSHIDAEARAALASTCAAVGDNYTRPSSSNVFDALARFETDHPACNKQVDGVVSRFFAGKRDPLRANTEIEPALRDMLIAMLDRAERTRQRVPFHIVVNTLDGDRNGAVQWALADSMRRFVGPAIDVLAQHSGSLDIDERLEITLSRPSCPTGAHSDNLRAHFELRDGTRRADWWRLIDNEYGIFLAAMTHEDAKLVCLMDQPTLSP
jgi:hypothetical protein